MTKLTRQKLNQILFLHSCTDNDTSMVKKYLEDKDDIDVLYHDGICLLLAIKNNNPEMLRLLIGYYLKDVNSNPEDRTIEELDKINRLKIVMDEVEEQYDFTEEIIEVLQFNKLWEQNYSEPDEESLSDFYAELSFEDFSFETYDNNFSNCPIEIYNEDNQEKLLNLSGQSIVTVEG